MRFAVLPIGSRKTRPSERRALSAQIRIGSEGESRKAVSKRSVPAFPPEAGDPLEGSAERIL